MLVKHTEWETLKARKYMKQFLSLILLSLMVIGCGAAPDGTSYLRNQGQSVVMLTAPSNFDSGGTGFALVAPSGETYTITNAHICRMAENNTLIAHTEGKDRIQIKVIEISTEHDLCILEAPQGVSGLRIGPESAEYDGVVVLGHPLLRPLTFSFGYNSGESDIQVRLEDGAQCTGPGFEKHMELGFMGFQEICLRSFRSISISATIYGGNSGSPLLNLSGEVIGVVFASDSRGNYGEAVPLEFLKEFIKGR